MRRSARNGFAVLGFLLAALAVWGIASAEEEPKDIGLVERAGARLAQLDVTVQGKSRTIETLRPEDFEIRVNRKLVEQFLVDQVCQTPSSPPAAETPRPTPAAPTPPTAAARFRAATFLFYFEQGHLTMAGRQRSLDLARELIPKLITGGSRGMIVSSAEELATMAPLTDDASRLLAAIDRLEKDRKQWDPYPTLEPKRIEEILDMINDPRGGSGVGISQAIGRARFYQAEESWRTQKALGRLRMVLGRLGAIDPPKAVVYFADTMRSQPGAHYLNLFSDAVQRREAPAASMAVDSAGGLLTFDRILNEAGALGVRFYTVQAEGLVDNSMSASVGMTGAYGARNNAVIPALRIRDAQDTLASMALETGGQSFLNGISGAKIATRVLQDFSCMYLISFSPAGFPEDEPLPVTVKILKPGLTAQVRGRLVIQSESTRLTSRLLAAFANPEAETTAPAGALRVSVVPTGFRDRAFTGLVQVSVPGTALPGTSWEIGASLVTRGKVQEEVSARLSVNIAGAPLVVEREMVFAPGPYEIVAVAREVTTGQILSRQEAGSWPEFVDEDVIIGPIVVLQPAVGAFVRDGRAQSKGVVAKSHTDPVRVDQPTALVGLVCRRPGLKDPVRAERRLQGETAVDFAPMDLDFGEDRCVQVRDVIRAGTMGEGDFRYEIHVMRAGEEIAKGDASFTALLSESRAQSDTAPAREAESR